MKSVAGNSGNWIFTDSEGFEKIAELNLKTDTIIEYRHLYLNKGIEFIPPKNRKNVLYPMYLIKYWPMQSVQKKHILIFIPILFLIYSAPSALDYVFHYPDEKYYTDAVLQMMDNKDYFTPYSAGGSYRFLKPIVTYWLLIFSYKLFGVSVFSSVNNL